MCLDTTTTPDSWVDICVEQYYGTSVLKVTAGGLTYDVRDTLQTQGIIDLCLKMCHIKDDAGAD